MAAEYMLKEGNEKVMLCERGIRTFETTYRFTLDLLAVPALRELTHLPIVVDPSHAAGRRDWVQPMSLRGGGGRRRRDHRRGPQRARRGDLRRAAGPRRPRVRRVRRAGAAGRRGRRQGADRRLAQSAPMRIAVLGVGLIGGSIGLAAKRRLGAEVAGFDPEPANARARRSRSARSTASARPSPRLLEGAEIVFCAAPVGALSRARARGARGERRGRGGHRRRLDQARARRAAAPAERPGGSSAATRWPAPRPRAWRTRAPTCSRAPAGT